MICARRSSLFWPVLKIVPLFERPPQFRLKDDRDGNGDDGQQVCDDPTERLELKQRCQHDHADDQQQRAAQQRDRLRAAEQQTRAEKHTIRMSMIARRSKLSSAHSSSTF
jgi:hypothetical protein